jgi:hypothetical protein
MQSSSTSNNRNSKPVKRRSIRINWLWPLLLTSAALLWIAQTVGVLPVSIGDLVARGWPIVLIALGLHGLLGGARIKLVNVLIVGICVALTGGLIVTAYARQNGQFRQDYKASFAQKLDADAQSVTIDLTTLTTQIDASATDAADGRAVEAQFVGSPASVFSGTYAVKQGVGAIILHELRPDAIPSLTQAGRGKLTLKLPVGVPINTLKIRGGTGDLALDLSGVTVKTLDVSLQGGDLLLTIPGLAANAGLGGTVRTAGGNLTVHVPNGVTIRLTLDSGRPDYDAANYLLVNGNTLQTNGTRDFQVALTAGASGTVSLKTP